MPRSASAPKLASAIVSDDQAYRYLLTRAWVDHPRRWLAFALLNPSTADATRDDPTVRRCVGFAQRDGYDGLLVVNPFAYRATDPAALALAADPVGPLNDEVLRQVARLATDVVLGWGASPLPPKYANRPLLAARTMAAVRAAAGHAGPLLCLGRTRDGSPRHPLYVPGIQSFEPYPLAFAPVLSQPR